LRQTNGSQICRHFQNFGLGNLGSKSTSSSIYSIFVMKSTMFMLFQEHIFEHCVNWQSFFIERIRLGNYVAPWH
jgi:hypothetical protein